MDFNELFQCFDSLSIFQFSEIDLSQLLYSFWRVGIYHMSKLKNYTRKKREKLILHFNYYYIRVYIKYIYNFTIYLKINTPASRTFKTLAHTHIVFGGVSDLKHYYYQRV